MQKKTSNSNKSTSSTKKVKAGSVLRAIGKSLLRGAALNAKINYTTAQLEMINKQKKRAQEYVKNNPNYSKRTKDFYAIASNRVAIRRGQAYVEDLLDDLNRLYD